MDKKVVIGLDLGIASVGYCLVEKETQEIILRGSHVFEILSNAKSGPNTKGGYGEGIRGEKRRARRLIRRRQTRKSDFCKLIESEKYKKLFNFSKTSILENKLNDKNYINKIWSEYDNLKVFSCQELNKIPYPIYELAAYGLDNELKPDELFKVLHARLSFRGVSYAIPKEDCSKPLSKQLLELLEKNKKLRDLNCRILNDLNDANKEEKEQKNHLLIFSCKRNCDDLKKIIQNCSWLGNLKEEFIKDFLGDPSSENISKKYGIFSRVRDYSYGPGTEKSRTDFGIYKKDGTQVKNLWEESIGICPVFNDLKRSLKCQIIPEISNLLSQLNSIKILFDNEVHFLSLTQKITIFRKIITEKVPLTLLKMSKWLSIKKDDIKGYPTNKDRSEHNFESCKNLIKIIKNEILIIKDFQELIEKSYELDILTEKYLINFYNPDEPSYCNKNYSQSIKLIKEKDINKIINNYENYCNLNPLTEKEMNSKTAEKIQESKNNYTKNVISGTHQLSLKALYEYIKENVNDNKTCSAFYFKQLAEFEKSQYKFSSYSKYLPEDLLKYADFISPNVKQTVRECCKILNKILKKYIFNNEKYILDAIVIETTNDTKYALHGIENNKRIINQQMNESKIKEKIRENYPGIKEETIEKISLLKQQNYTDLYDGYSINEKDIINNPDQYEIDHILPISRTQNNNQNNKAITKKLNNKNKGNRTLYEWKSSSEFEELKIKWISIFEKTNIIKLNNLLMKDLKLKERSFIARNLTETQYIIRRIKLGFIAYYDHIMQHRLIDDNWESTINQLKDMQILTVSGEVTQRIRNKKLSVGKKDREISSEHHSVDASICAMLGTLTPFRETLNSLIRIINNETGKWEWKYNDKRPLDIFDYEIISNNEWVKISSNIKKSGWWLSTKYTNKLDKYKTLEEKLTEINSWKSKKLSDETIYGYVDINEEHHQKEKINLLKTDEKQIQKLKSIFGKDYKYPDCLNSKNYFDALKKIWFNSISKFNLNLEDLKENPFHLYMEDQAIVDLEFKLSLSKSCVKIIDNNLNADIKKITVLGNKINGYLLKKMSKNAMIDGLTAKCVYLVKKEDQKIIFLNENYLNLGKEKCEKNNWEIIDVIEIGQIYNINNVLFKIIGCHKTNGCLQWKNIENKKEKTRQNPYSTFPKEKIKTNFLFNNKQ